LAAGAATFVRAQGPLRLGILADAIAAGSPRSAIVTALPSPDFAAAARQLLAALPHLDASTVTYLRGVADGYRARADEVHVEPVWSGPTTNSVPVQLTGRVLTDLIAGAARELLLMTYSARPQPGLAAALAAAVGRGVAVTVVVETLAGAGGALSGNEPAAAFAGICGLTLWHWPPEQRERGVRMHAKLAVADRRVLLLTSANLTPSGLGTGAGGVSSGSPGNIEAGLLITGGTAPRRAAEHIDELRARGLLTRLSTGGTWAERPAEEPRSASDPGMSAAEAGATPPVGPTDSVSPTASALQPAWSALLDTAIDDAERALLHELGTRLAGTGVPPPEQGYEVGNGYPVDLSWPNRRIAVLFNPDQAVREALAYEGWRVLDPDADHLVDALTAGSGRAHDSSAREA
jgi:hypothetical protein